MSNLFPGSVLNLSHRPISAAPNTRLIVVGFPVDEKTTKPAARLTRELPVLGWQDTPAGLMPLVGAPLLVALTGVVDRERLIRTSTAIEIDGMVFEWESPEIGFNGVMHASVAEFEAAVGDSSGLSEAKWKEAVKEFRSDAQVFQRQADRQNPPVFEVSNAAETNVFTGAPLEAREDFASWAKEDPTRPPTDDTPEEIAEARRNLAILHESGVVEAAPAEEPTVAAMQDADPVDETDASDLV